MIGNLTKIAQLRFEIAHENEDLRRFEQNPEQNAESIGTTKRIIEQKEAEFALYTPD
jgi:hypothetical protein